MRWSCCSCWSETLRGVSGGMRRSSTLQGFGTGCRLSERGGGQRRIGELALSKLARGPREGSGSLC